MDPLVMLIVPILVSSVLIFFASFVLWSFLPGWHRADWKHVEKENLLVAAIREAGVRRGQYMFPKAGARPPKTWSEEEARLVKEGPRGSVIIFPPGPPQMGKSLGLWFVYLLLVSVFVAYLTSRTIAPGADYLFVFRVAGTSAFLAYAGAVPVNSIWFGHSWSSTFKSIIDGLIYGVITAGTFGWLWPG